VFLAEIGLDEPPGRSQSDFMKLLLLVSFSGLAILGTSVQAAETLKNTDPQACRLTAELRDGSRVVGASGEKYFRFHSPLLGDLKLAAQDVRSVECVSSNAAKLVTSRGDSLTVSFTDSSFPLKTAFGKVELAVAQLRKLTVSVAGTGGAHRPGLVALWSGEGDGKDSAGNHNLELFEVSYADGQVGRAFAMNGFSSCMKLADSADLNPGTDGGGLTISAWIRPDSVSGFHPILEWNPINKIPGTIGVQLWLGTRPDSQGVLAAHMVGAEGDSGNYQPHSLVSHPGTVVTGRFQHVAATYDKTTGNGVLYVNGQVVSREQWGRFEPLTTGDLWISRRPTDHPGDWNTFFSGLLDEIAIYNRALSTEEIQAVCSEENHGELPAAPPVGRMMPTLNGGF
jgi:hypothetical protein